MIQKLINQIKEKNAPIVVGLDPTMKLMPKSLVDKYINEYGQTLEAVGEAMFDYNRQIMDACADLIPAVKPQIAMYESFGIPGMIAYKKTVDYAKELGLIVIADIKRCERIGKRLQEEQPRIVRQIEGSYLIACAVKIDQLRITRQIE